METAIVSIRQPDQDHTDLAVTLHTTSPSHPVVHTEEAPVIGLWFIRAITMDATSYVVNTMQAAEMRMIQDLRDVLALNEDHTALVAGMPRSALRAFQAGRRPLPRDAQRRLEGTHAELQRLLRIFRRDRLPQIVRRRSPAFNNETALAWILAGRIGDVVRVCERALTYQS